MYHVAGWVVAFLPTALVGGATVVPEIGFDVVTLEGIGGADGAAAGRADVAAAGRRAAEAALDAAREHRVTVVPGAPGFYHHLLAVDGAERALSSVRTADLGDRAAGLGGLRRGPGDHGPAGLGGLRTVGVRIRGHQHARGPPPRGTARSAGRWPASSCGSSGPTGTT